MILRLIYFRAVAPCLRHASQEWARARTGGAAHFHLAGRSADSNVVTMDDDASDDPLDGGGSLGSGAGVVAMETNAANIRVVVRCRPVLAGEAAAG